MLLWQFMRPFFVVVDFAREMQGFDEFTTILLRQYSLAQACFAVSDVPADLCIIRQAERAKHNERDRWYGEGLSGWRASGCKPDDHQSSQRPRAPADDRRPGKLRRSVS